MNEYLISKYSHEPHNEAIDKDDQWTSWSDVGKVYNGSVFTLEDYIKAENAFLSFVQRICEATKTNTMRISGLEDYFSKCSYKNGAALTGTNNIISVVRSCLREEFWCRLQSKNLFFHFGYDYYFYVGCYLDYDTVKGLLKDTDLHAIIRTSPYHQI